MPRSRTFRLPGAALVAVAALTFTSVGAAAEDSSSGDDSTRNPTSKRFHEETPHPGAQTVRHWSGQSVNPADGHTYTYDIVGADPSTGRAATISIDIPAVDGVVRTNPATNIGFAAVDDTWFQPQVEGLIPQLHLSPQRLAVFLTSDLVLYADHMPKHCCVIGAHGAVPTTSPAD